MLEALKEVLPKGEKAVPIPATIDARVKRGLARMQQEAGKRNECLAFWRGEQYRYVNGEGQLLSQPTTTQAYEKTGKPPHVVRRVRNLMFDIIEHEVAYSTQKVPQYEVAPSTPDPEDESSARLSGQILRYGFDKWKLRRAVEGVVRYAVIADEGFAWPYFDNSVGPYIDDGQGGRVGQGEIRCRVFGGNEVFWEPGVNFDDSRWLGIRQAQDIEEVEEMDGFTGVQLRPDAQNSEYGGERTKNATKLVLVTEYLERPSSKHPVGRWFTMANGSIIIGERPYPCTDPNGEAVDEPVLHRLSYAMDPDSDRDKGLGRHLLDPQRMVNNATNKETMWVDLAMNPQLVIWNGGFAKGQRMTNEPGAVYQAQGTGKVEWRPVPAMPSSLAESKEDAKRDMQKIAAQNEIFGTSAARAVSTLIERDESRRYNFTVNLADFYSRLGRHCLYLVQKHYTEKRLIKIQGDFGPDSIPEFLGSQLRGQADVTVLPGSLETPSKQVAEQRILGYAERGWVSGQAAMAAIAGGNAESLIQSYQKDVSRAHQIIRKIKLGPEVLFATPPRFENGQEVDGWMPREFDNVDVQMSVFEDWMKTVEFDTLEPGMQEAAQTYYQALKQIKAQKQAEQAQAQEMMAVSQGAANAAKPQGPIPTPDAASEQIPT